MPRSGYKMKKKLPGLGANQVKQLYFILFSPSTLYPNGRNELVKAKNNFLTAQGLDTPEPKIIFPSGPGGRP